MLIQHVMTNTTSSDADPGLFLIDASGFIFRAFHALPMMTRKDGTPVNAVYGFVNILHRLLKEFHAADIAVIFDATRKNFRNDIYPLYKANRSEPPSELVPQFALIREATEAFCMPGIELDGFEADDLIATYVRMAVAAGRKATIVSADKDLLQLLQPGVTMLDPIKYNLAGPEAAFDKFGVTPDKVVEVQALAGDSTDNVPGVPGIGVKTAAELINEYGDLENLLANADKIKQPKRRQLLIDYADQARLSRRLVQLDAYAPVTVPLSDLHRCDTDPAKMVAFLEVQGFKSLVAKFGGASAQRMAQDSGAPLQQSLFPEMRPTIEPSKLFENINVNYRMVQNEAVLREFIVQVQDEGVLCFDAETDSLIPASANLIGLAVTAQTGEGIYIPLKHNTDQPQLTVELVMEILKPVMEDASILKVAHNAKFDLQFFMRHGVNVTSVDDTMLMSYILDGTAHNHGMDELARLFLNTTTISYDDLTGKGKQRIALADVPLEQVCQYAAEDVDITLRLHKVLKPRIAAEKMARIYEEAERPLIDAIARMELTGILIDRDRLAVMSKRFADKLVDLQAEIFKLTGADFNIGSPKQLGEVLFGNLGLPGGRKSKTGEWSTAVDVLEPLAAQGHTVVEQVLEWRQLSKLKGTYTDALPLQIQPNTGRVHTSYAMAVVSTGRLSSSDPNLQNIPIRTEEGKAIRTAFIADQGYSLIAVDYSQIELRLLASMADIPALKQAYLDGVDVHALTASEVLGVPLDAVTSDLRRSAKAVNFGIIYGISNWGLAKQLGISAQEAGDYIKRYFVRFPELRDYMEATKQEARQHGYVRTLMGRKCVIPGIRDNNPARRAGAERQAINAPLQGTAADIMKLAMIDVHNWIIETNSPARLMLQVHDELVLEAPVVDAPGIAQRVSDIMEAQGAKLGLAVPLTAEVDIAESWS